MKFEKLPRMSDAIFADLRSKALKYGHNTPSEIKKSMLRQINRLAKQDRLVMWDDYVAGVKVKK